MSDVRPSSNYLRTNSNSRLCSECQAIFTFEYPKGEYTAHHTNSAAYMTAVEHGCYFCTWTWRHYQSGEHRTVSHVTYSLSPLDTRAGDEGYSIYFTIHSTYVEHTSVCVFSGYRIESNCLIPNYVQNILDPSVRAPRSLQVARTWLEDCIFKHPECQVSRQHTSLPSRLVHVWQNATDSKIDAKICRGKTLPANTLYLSLSHCWGKTKFLTTTRENIDEFESSVPVDKLSRTFQDALLATISLGFEYIWIDSLCIVQDDKDEWSRESKLMGEVYKNATCNISASAFANGEDGFMLRQRRLDPTPVVVDINWQDTENTLLESCRRGTYWFVHDNPWTEITEGPVFQRAWVLQEQLLASSALHLGEDQMFWECRSTFANEVWPRGWMETSYQRSFEMFLWNSGVWQVKVADAFSNDENPFETWYKIVANYSRRHVTIASDRLPALAGMASEFETGLKSRYCYGLWGDDIHYGLLYMQNAFHTTRDSTTTPLWEDAPSWSWAAHHNEVYWKRSLWEPRDDHFGICKIEIPTAIDGRVLRLNGMLIPLLSNKYKRLSLAFGLSTIQGVNAAGFKILLYPDAWFLSSFQTEESNINRTDLSHTTTTALCKAIVLAPILCQSFQTQAMYQSCSLMLCVQPGLAKGVYRRAGVAELRLEGGNEKDNNIAIAALRAYQEPLQDEWYHETDGAGNYEFSIV